MQIFVNLRGWASLCCAGVVNGCVATQEAAVRSRLERVEPAWAQEPQQRKAELPKGELEAYVAYAAKHQPELRAAFERWRASVHQIQPARRLPEPMLEFAAYVWNSGDNQGFTPARVGVRQELPWPTALSGRATAATHEAEALQRQFESQLLRLRERVAAAYYELWLLRRLRAIEQEQLVLMQGVSQSVLARIATGSAILADQQQVALSVARLADRIAARNELERSAQARLRAVVGAPASVALPTEVAPTRVSLPSEHIDELREALLQHPSLDALVSRERAAQALSDVERASRWPSLSVGVEWMQMPGGMGESAVMPSVGLRLPVWQGSYTEAERANRAVARARQADHEAAVQQAVAELEQLLAQLNDSFRRVELARTTLLPQARAAHESVLGAYAAGQAPISASILAQRELLEIRSELEQARVEHAVAWARLEQLVGRSVARTPAQEAGNE